METPWGLIIVPPLWTRICVQVQSSKVSVQSLTPSNICISPSLFLLSLLPLSSFPPPSLFFPSFLNPSSYSPHHSQQSQLLPFLVENRKVEIEKNVLHKSPQSSRCVSFRKVCLTHHHCVPPRRGNPSWQTWHASFATCIVSWGASGQNAERNFSIQKFVFLEFPPFSLALSTLNIFLCAYIMSNCFSFKIISRVLFNFIRNTYASKTLINTDGSLKFKLNIEREIIEQKLKLI